MALYYNIGDKSSHVICQRDDKTQVILPLAGVKCLCESWINNGRKAYCISFQQRELITATLLHHAVSERRSIKLR